MDKVSKCLILGSRNWPMVVFHPDLFVESLPANLRYDERLIAVITQNWPTGQILEPWEAQELISDMGMLRVVAKALCYPDLDDCLKAAQSSLAASIKDCNRQRAEILGLDDESTEPGRVEKITTPAEKKQDDCRPVDGERWKSPAGPVWTWGNGGRWADSSSSFVMGDSRTRAHLRAAGWAPLTEASKPEAVPRPKAHSER